MDAKLRGFLVALLCDLVSVVFSSGFHGHSGTMSPVSIPQVGPCFASDARDAECGIDS
jgi:hypothetical protein